MAEARITLSPPARTYPDEIRHRLFDPGGETMTPRGSTPSVQDASAMGVPMKVAIAIATAALALGAAFYSLSNKMDVMGVTLTSIKENASERYESMQAEIRAIKAEQKLQQLQLQQIQLDNAKTKR